MDDLFQHRDIDGDELRVSEPEGDLERHMGGLLFAVFPNNGPEAASSALPRHRVRSLCDALNRWLDEQQRNDPDPAGRPVASQEPIYEALIRRLVAEEVARVLPLHQSPQAAVPGLCTDTACGYPLDHRAEDPAGGHLCVDPSCTSTVSHLEHDPEPQAVGHPEVPSISWSDKLFGVPDYTEGGLDFDYCAPCGHSWGAHSGGEGCTAQLGKTKCICTRGRTRKPGESAPEDKCTCTHKYAYTHSSESGCTMTGCECTWTRGAQ